MLRRNSPLADSWPVVFLSAACHGAIVVTSQRPEALDADTSRHCVEICDPPLASVRLTNLMGPSMTMTRHDRRFVNPSGCEADPIWCATASAVQPTLLSSHRRGRRSTPPHAWRDAWRQSMQLGTSPSRERRAA